MDTLFVACTRPTVKWGVPYAGIKANFMVCGFVTLLAANPLCLLLVAFVHMTMRELSRVDPHFFRKWILWGTSKGRSKTVHLWGGSRLQPSPSSIRSAREVRSSL